MWKYTIKKMRFTYYSSGAYWNIAGYISNVRRVHHEQFKYPLISYEVTSSTGTRFQIMLLDSLIVKIYRYGTIGDHLGWELYYTMESSMEVID